MKVNNIMGLLRKEVKNNNLDLTNNLRQICASIDALYPPGSMTTKLLTFQGRRMVINADAEKGYILVELTDHEGRPIPGYTKQECVQFRKDDVCSEVQWKGSNSLEGGNSLASLRGEAVHITFYMQTARLYSFKLC